MSDSRESPISVTGAVRAAILAVLILPGMPAVGAADESPLLRFLVDSAGFPKKDIEGIGDRVLVRELDVADSSRGAAFAAIVRIDGDGTGLGDTAESIDFEKVNGAADGFGRFSDPAEAGDVASMRFADDELEVLAACEMTRCKFKLGRAGIEALSQVDWNASDAGDRFTALFQEEVLEYVRRYRRNGRDALVVYEDKASPVSVADANDALLAQRPEFDRDAPLLAKRFRAYPHADRSSVTDSIVWSMKNFGYRPTVSIDHVFVDRAPEIQGATMMVAIKTIYANHYIAGRIQLGAVIDGQEALGVSGHYIVVVDQIRFDDELNRFQRKLLGRGLRSDAEAHMKLLRSLAEASGS